MKALAKGLMTIALLAATTACDGSPTGSSAFVSEGDGIAMASQPSSTLSFSSTQTYDFASRTAQSASGSAGGIEFAGSLETGTPCVNVSATHNHRRNDVTVTVTATDNGNICQQVITHNNYTGRVSGVAAGSYSFTVVHSAGGRSQTAWSGAVTVQ
ncbi:MAG TPA: hypothetical protein VHG93_10850 [Longimicrobium sp.]|nr:hypothetical protein [Longimicrobium sp.]